MILGKLIAKLTALRFKNKGTIMANLEIKIFAGGQLREHVATYIDRENNRLVLSDTKLKLGRNQGGFPVRTEEEFPLGKSTVFDWTIVMQGKVEIL